MCRTCPTSLDMHPWSIEIASSAIRSSEQRPWRIYLSNSHSSSPEDGEKQETRKKMKGKKKKYDWATISEKSWTSDSLCAATLFVVVVVIVRRIYIYILYTYCIGKHCNANEKIYILSLCVIIPFFMESSRTAVAGKKADPEKRKENEENIHHIQFRTAVTFLSRLEHPQTINYGRADIVSLLLFSFLSLTFLLFLCLLLYGNWFRVSSH